MLLAGCASGPLILGAASQGDRAKVTALLDAGADVNATDSRGNTALYFAAMRGHTELAALLLERGADPNSSNQFRRTPVHVAARYGHGDVIRILAKNGADVDRRSFNRSVRGPALDPGGARAIDRQQVGGARPLMVAARSGQLEAVKALVDAGAELPARAEILRAAELGYREIARYLTQTAQRIRTQQKFERPAYPRRIAAVVGVSRYRKRPSLEGASRDAERVAAILHSMGFDEVLELYDEQATRTGILDLLGRRLPAAAGEDDLVFIYFAGHGETETLPDGSKRGYILPFDAGSNVSASGISMETVRDLSNRMAARHIFYAIDACYSGIALDTSRSLRAGGPGRAVQLVAAGTEGQRARERGGQGLFTIYLIRGLEGDADHNSDGVVSGSELGSYLRRSVGQASGGLQTPQFGNLDGLVDVAFPVGGAGS